MRLATSEIAVWSLNRRTLPNKTASVLLDLLTPAEMVRMQRYLKVEDQARFGLARGALRHLSARYLGTDPGALTLGFGSHDKPHWTGHRLKFNVSHSGDWALLAFACEIEIGIDVQQISQQRDMLGIAGISLHPDEEAYLTAIADPATRQSVFFDLWVMREAALKATGEGLSGNRQNFSALPLPHGTGWTGRRYRSGAKTLPLQFHSCGTYPGHASVLAVVADDAKALQVRVNPLLHLP